MTYSWDEYKGHNITQKVKYKPYEPHPLERILNIEVTKT